MAQVSQEPEIILAQRLASNEKPIRTKALKTLRKYIHLRSQKAEGGFTSEDLLKIWKGLFYCLWMQDKLLQQEEISHKLSGLIHSFNNTDTQLLYFTTFLQTVKREWNGIDNLRLDKFYQLVRFMFRQAFEVLKRRKWEPSVVNQFLHVFTKQLLQNTEHVPKGLLMHVLDLYMTELAQVGTTELTAEQNLTFIHPFFQAMAKTKDDLLLALISKNIFRTILDHAPFAIEDLIKELQQGVVDDSDSVQTSGEEEEELKNQVLKKTKVKKVNGISEVMENSKGIKEEQDLYSKDSGNDDGVGPVLQFDYGAVADCLFEFGSRLTTRNTNRKRMYSFVTAFRNLNEGIFNREESDKGEGSNTSDKKVLKKKSKKKRKNERLTTGDEPVAKKRKAACQDKQKASNSLQNGSLNNTTEEMEKERVVLKESDSQDQLEAGVTVKKKKRKSKKVKTISQDTEREAAQEFQESDGEHKSNTYEVEMKKNSLKATSGFGNTQTSTEVKTLGQKPEMASVVEHPVEAAEAECGIFRTQEKTTKKNKMKNAGEDKMGTETGRRVMETHGDPGEVEASTMEKKRRKSKKLCSSLQEVGEVVAVQSLPKEDSAGDEITPQKEDGSNNATQSQLGTSTLQTKKVKRTMSSLKNLGVEFKSLAVLGNCEDGVTQCELNARTTRKKKDKGKKLMAHGSSSHESKEVDSTSQDSSAVVVKVIATPADEVPCAESQSSKAPLVKTKKSMKKKKATEETGSKYQVDLDVRDPEVSSDSAHITTTPKNITNECPQPKVKKGKKKKQSLSNEESMLEAKEPLAEATSSKQTRTPCKKKKIQKKQESQSAEAREESVPTVKEKTRTEVSDTLPSDSSISTPDVIKSLIPMKKGKKKRKLWTDETEMSQSNGPAQEELSGKKVKVSGIEVNTTVTPKRRKMEKSTPKSNFVSFQGLIKPPTPLFCKTKPKVSTPQTSFKHKFQTPKSETKKVTFGLKNNKTTEFRKTDKSLLVSPVGSSRVAFDPKKMPSSGVLKSSLPSPVTSVKKCAANKRATAADFF